MAALSDVIAERQLDARDASDAPISVIVRIGRPEPHPDGGWVCPLQILGLGDEKVYAAGGEDSLQALLLGVKMARTHLEYRKDRSIRLDFAGMPDFGMSI